jgi:hypothetical protein
MDGIHSMQELISLTGYQILIGTWWRVNLPKYRRGGKYLIAQREDKGKPK